MESMKMETKVFTANTQHTSQWLHPLFWPERFSLVSLSFTFLLLFLILSHSLCVPNKRWRRIETEWCPSNAKKEIWLRKTSRCFWFNKSNLFGCWAENELIVVSLSLSFSLSLWTLSIKLQAIHDSFLQYLLQYRSHQAIDIFYFLSIEFNLQRC